MSNASDHEKDMDIYQDYPWQDDENDKVDDEEEIVVDEENEKDEKEEEADEKEDVDEEADKRYWEAKAKEGVQKVCLVISETVDNIKKFTAKEKKSCHTRYTAHLSVRCSCR
jgi:hypothetical protein